MSKYIAEFIGTLFLVFAGTASIVHLGDLFPGGLSHIMISIIFGLIVAIVIYTYGDISGAHINPAVSLAFAIAGKFPWKNIPGYLIAQFTGAIAGAGVTMYVFGTGASGNLGSTLPSIAISKAFFLEAFLSLILMQTILHVSTGSKEKGIMAGAAIGAVIAMEAMLGGPATGASMNPARSLGPALLSGNLQHLWLYMLAPCVGTCLSVFICKMTRSNDCCNGEC